VLFAENFNPRSVLPLLRELRAASQRAYVTVLSPSAAVLDAVRVNASRCMGADADVLYLRGTLAKFSGHRPDTDSKRYDFIEHRLDSSESVSDLTAILLCLAQKLSADGTLGLSWFADSALYRTMRYALQLQNTSSALPFHFMPTENRLASHLLHAWGLANHADDSSLVQFLASGRQGMSLEFIQAAAHQAGLRLVSKVEEASFAHAERYAPELLELRHLGFSDDAILELKSTLFRRAAYFARSENCGARRFIIDTTTLSNIDDEMGMGIEMSIPLLYSSLLPVDLSGEVILQHEIPAVKTVRMQRTVTVLQTRMLRLLSAPIRVRQMYAIIRRELSDLEWDVFVHCLSDVLQYLDAIHAIVCVR
jgi:hypothetical protein